MKKQCLLIELLSRIADAVKNIIDEFKEEIINQHSYCNCNGDHSCSSDTTVPDQPAPVYYYTGGNAGNPSLNPDYSIEFTTMATAYFKDADGNPQIGSFPIFRVWRKYTAAPLIYLSTDLVNHIIDLSQNNTQRITPSIVQVNIGATIDEMAPADGVLNQFGQQVGAYRPLLEDDGLNTESSHQIVKEYYVQPIWDQNIYPLANLNKTGVFFYADMYGNGQVIGSETFEIAY